MSSTKQYTKQLNDAIEATRSQLLDELSKAQADQNTALAARDAAAHDKWSAYKLMGREEEALTVAGRIEELAARAALLSQNLSLFANGAQSDAEAALEAMAAAAASIKDAKSAMEILTSAVNEAGAVVKADAFGDDDANKGSVACLAVEAATTAVNELKSQSLTTSIKAAQPLAGAVAQTFATLKDQVGTVVAEATKARDAARQELATATVNRNSTWSRYYKTIPQFEGPVLAKNGLLHSFTEIDETANFGLKVTVSNQTPSKGDKSADEDEAGLVPGLRGEVQVPAADVNEYNLPCFVAVKVVDADGFSFEGATPHTEGKLRSLSDDANQWAAKAAAAAKVAADAAQAVAVAVAANLTTAASALKTATAAAETAATEVATAAASATKANDEAVAADATATKLAAAARQAETEHADAEASVAAATKVAGEVDAADGAETVEAAEAAVADAKSVAKDAAAKEATARGAAKEAAAKWDLAKQQAIKATADAAKAAANAAEAIAQVAAAAAKATTGDNTTVLNVAGAADMTKVAEAETAAAEAADAAEKAASEAADAAAAVEAASKPTSEAQQGAQLAEQAAKEAADDAKDVKNAKRAIEEARKSKDAKALGAAEVAEAIKIAKAAVSAQTAKDAEEKAKTLKEAATKKGAKAGEAAKKTIKAVDAARKAASAAKKAADATSGEPADAAKKAAMATFDAAKAAKAAAEVAVEAAAAAEVVGTAAAKQTYSAILENDNKGLALVFGESYRIFMRQASSQHSRKLTRNSLPSRPILARYGVADSNPPALARLRCGAGDGPCDPFLVAFSLPALPVHGLEYRMIIVPRRLWQPKLAYEQFLVQRASPADYVKLSFERLAKPGVDLPSIIHAVQARFSADLHTLAPDANQTGIKNKVTSAVHNLLGSLTPDELTRTALVYYSPVEPVPGSKPPGSKPDPFDFGYYSDMAGDVIDPSADAYWVAVLAAASSPKGSDAEGACYLLGHSIEELGALPPHYYGSGAESSSDDTSAPAPAPATAS